jgi:serine/threonine protein kinase
MHYLETKNIIHRDLALRNLLVTTQGSDVQKYLVKVGDFGLSKETNEGIYQASSTKTIPGNIFVIHSPQYVLVKWSAPEDLVQRMYTSKADVWSFGITLYELFGYGAVPYPALSNVEVLEKLQEGYRMPKLPGKNKKMGKPYFL